MTRRRIVHLGLGNFHRAHQCWWTGVVAEPGDDEQWSVTAFTGRRPDAARLLEAQGCRYTLIERDGGGDRYTLVTALERAHDGNDLDAFRAAMTDPATGIVTLTVTEAGYHLGRDGTLDVTDAAIAADRAAPGEARTAPGRLLLGLDARRRADSGPIAVVPCDNVTANGRALRNALLTMSGPTGLADWIATSVSFVDTSVDRITPRPTSEDIAEVKRATGFDDQAPVVTEPFRDWILSGGFAAGRPAWERENARFVPDIEPWERRKLWLLNGAHSLLAYTGLARGHATVAAAIGDPDVSDLVEAWWDEAAPLLGGAAGDTSAYRRDLRARFANPAIAHRLGQIAEDGLYKLRVRVAEPALLRRRARQDADAAAAVIAAWIDYTGTPDGAKPGIAPPPGTGPDTRSHVAALSEPLADDTVFVSAVDERRRTRRAA